MKRKTRQRQKENKRRWETWKTGEILRSAKGQFIIKCYEFINEPFYSFFHFGCCLHFNSATAHSFPIHFPLARPCTLLPSAIVAAGWSNNKIAKKKMIFDEIKSLTAVLRLLCDLVGRAIKTWHRFEKWLRPRYCVDVPTIDVGSHPA